MEVMRLSWVAIVKTRDNMHYVPIMNNPSTKYPTGFVVLLPLPI